MCTYCTIPFNLYSVCNTVQVSGDMLFSHNFDVGQVLDYFKLRVR